MTTRVGAELRLRRLLAAVPWIVANDGPPVAEVCRRFGFTESQLADDLDLLMLCGVEPFTADTMIETDIADGRVYIRLPGWFSRPLTLTPTEALAVVAAGQALAEVPGVGESGPLARGIEKLAAALGLDPGDVDVQLGQVEPEVLATLRGAESSSHQVELDYYAYGRDDWTRRIIDPHRVFSATGAWYVTGFCHRAGEERLFRVDRIRDPKVLDTTFVPPPPGPPPQLFHPDPNDPVMVVDLAPRARGLAEEYAVHNEGTDELPSGGLRIRLRGERAYLARLLLFLGPDGEVVEGDASAGVDAAARLLERYRGAGGTR